MEHPGPRSTSGRPRHYRTPLRDCSVFSLALSARRGKSLKKILRVYGNGSSEARESSNETIRMSLLSSSLSPGILFSIHYSLLGARLFSRVRKFSYPHSSRPSTLRKQPIRINLQPCLQVENLHIRCFASSSHSHSQRF